MAEPIGLVASVIQVAGAGIKLSQALYQYADGVATADKRIKDIAKEIQLTSFVIEELGQVFEDDETSSLMSKNAIRTANETIKECSSVFAEIDVTLRKSKKNTFGRLMLPFRDNKIELLRNHIDKLKTKRIDHEAEAKQRAQIQELIDQKKLSSKKYEESLRNISISSTLMGDEDEASDEGGVSTSNRAKDITALAIEPTITSEVLETCVHRIRSLLKNLENLQQVLTNNVDGDDHSEHHQNLIGSYFQAREHLDGVLFSGSQKWGIRRPNQDDTRTGVQITANEQMQFDNMTNPTAITPDMSKLGADKDASKPATLTSETAGLKQIEKDTGAQAKNHLIVEKRRDDSRSPSKDLNALKRPEIITEYDRRGKTRDDSPKVPLTAGKASAVEAESHVVRERLYAEESRSTREEGDLYISMRKLLMTSKTDEQRKLRAAHESSLQKDRTSTVRPDLESRLSENSQPLVGPRLRRNKLSLSYNYIRTPNLRAGQEFCCKQDEAEDSQEEDGTFVYNSRDDSSTSLRRQSVSMTATQLEEQRRLLAAALDHKQDETWEHSLSTVDKASVVVKEGSWETHERSECKPFRVANYGSDEGWETRERGERKPFWAPDIRNDDSDEESEKQNDEVDNLIGEWTTISIPSKTTRNSQRDQYWTDMRNRKRQHKSSQSITD